jgi:hypothetical protein
MRDTSNRRDFGLISPSGKSPSAKRKKQARQSDRDIGNEPACNPERGYGDSSLSRQGGQRRIRRTDKVEIGNCPIGLSLLGTPKR